MTTPVDEETGGPFLDLMASFGLSISSLTAEIQRFNAYNDAQESRVLETLPRGIAMIQQSTLLPPSVATTDLLDFGSPAPGRQWEVRLLGVISATAAGGFVAMATTFTTWYVGQKMTGNAAGILPLSFVRWQFATVPAFKDLSGDQLKVLPQEHLYAGLTGIPAAPTQIMGIAVINDIPLFTGRAVVQA